MDTSSYANSLSSQIQKDGIIGNATHAFTDVYNKAYANSSLFIGLFIVILVTVVFATILYWYIGSQLFSKVKSEVYDTRIPVIGNKLTKFTADINKNSNGYRRSYSFWVYINDMAKYKGQYQNIVSLSASATEPEHNNCSPHVFLDKNNNSMYIRFANKVKDETKYNIDNAIQLHKYMRQGIEIKYIPLQRWVHIAIVCNNDTFKNTIYAYVDGDIVSTISHGDNFKLSRYANTIYDSSATTDTSTTHICTNQAATYYSTCTNQRAQLDDINLNVTGYLYIGESDNNKNQFGAGFSGVLSSFTSYNYELNQQDIYEIYKTGPINGLLARLGLGLYGLRNPVYKL